MCTSRKQGLGRSLSVDKCTRTILGPSSIALKRRYSVLLITRCHNPILRCVTTKDSILRTPPSAAGKTVWLLLTRECLLSGEVVHHIVRLRSTVTGEELPDTAPREAVLADINEYRTVGWCVAILWRGALRWHRPLPSANGNLRTPGDNPTPDQ